MSLNKLRKELSEIIADNFIRVDILIMNQYFDASDIFDITKEALQKKADKEIVKL